MPGYGETRLAEPEHLEICESWLTSAEKIVTLKYPAWWKMTALSECAVEKEGLHELASRIKLIDSDCWMDRRAARENRTMLLCKGWTHDATRAKLSQRKRRKNQSTKCVYAFATWNMHYRNTRVNTRQHCRLNSWIESQWLNWQILRRPWRPLRPLRRPPTVKLNFQKATNWRGVEPLHQIWAQWELIECEISVQRLNFRFKRLQMEMPLSVPEYWLEWTKDYFKKKHDLRPVLAELRACKRSTPPYTRQVLRLNQKVLSCFQKQVGRWNWLPIYRLTTAVCVSDIYQTNINRDIRDGNWLSRKAL